MKAALACERTLPDLPYAELICFPCVSKVGLRVPHLSCGYNNAVLLPDFLPAPQRWRNCAMTEKYFRSRFGGRDENAYIAISRRLAEKKVRPKTTTDLR